MAFLVDKRHAGIRLDRYLRDRLPWRSRTGIQRVIEDGRILRKLPGEREERISLRPAGRLVAGETVVFLVPERRDSPPPPPPAAELSIVYEDRFLLAVDKPPFLPVHPSARYRTETLISLLHRRYRRRDDPRRDVVPKLCHRIDRETSGLVLVSKDDLVRTKLGKVFEGRKVEKEYLAIVEGKVKDRRGKIDLPLAPARESQVQIRMEARHDGKGLPSVTDYEVRGRYPGYTLVAARPLSGRQHQIRAHLAAIGHPIVGDKIYGPDESLFLKSLESDLEPEDLRLLKMPRQALHAHRLCLDHPVERRRLELEAPLPGDMKEFLRSLEEAPGTSS